MGGATTTEATEVWVVRGGALGDFAATVPLLVALRERVGRLVVVASPSRRALFDGADRWLDIDGVAAGRVLAGKEELAGVELGLAWTSTWREALRACGVREVDGGGPRPPAGVGIYHHLWAPLQARGFGTHPGAGPVPVDPRALALVDARLQGPPVVIAPGSGGGDKRWGLDRWARVAAAVPGPVVWVGGPQEAGEAGWGTPRWDDLDVAGLIALATRCRCWLGPDAGPTHVAAAAGARVAVVFTGATDPRCWAPPGATVFVRPDPRALVGWVRGSGAFAKQA